MKHPSVLRRRAGLLRSVRKYFDDHGFLEVQTPCLSADSIADRYVDPLEIRDPTLPGGRMMLHTSPELAMKRLLALGAGSIYQIAPVFRRGDRGAWHNVEFTMLEWYRLDATYEDGMCFLSGFIAEMLDRGPAERRPFGRLFELETGLDPHTTDAAALRCVADKRGIAYPASFLRENNAGDAADPELWVDLLFSELVQPYLGLENPILVYDYPAWQGQLAKVEDGRARRFELFVDGLELANGYDELLDPELLRSRNASINEKRAGDGRATLPQERFLRAVEEHGLPRCGGCALGLDRLLMVLCGTRLIDDVLAFPVEEA